MRVSRQGMTRGGREREGMVEEQEDKDEEKEGAEKLFSSWRRRTREGGWGEIAGEEDKDEEDEENEEGAVDGGRRLEEEVEEADFHMHKDLVQL